MERPAHATDSTSGDRTRPRGRWFVLSLLALAALPLAGCAVGELGLAANGLYSLFDSGEEEEDDTDEGASLRTDDRAHPRR